MEHVQPVILHAIDTTGPGGAETVFLQLVDQLKIPGYKNIAIIKGPGWVEDQLIKRQVDYRIIKPRGFFSLPYYWELLKFIKSHSVKVIQANLLGSTLTYSMLSILLRIPLVATLHGRVDVNPQERFVKIKNLLMRLGVSRLVAVSQDLANYLDDRKLFNKNTVNIIYNGVDTAKYGKNQFDAIRQQLKLPQNAILIGSVGNVRPAKDYDNLIETAALIHQQHPNIHFVVAGHKKPELMARLEKKVIELELTSVIHFVGFVDDSAAFLGQMDYFLLSSSTEGFSIATIEAMASGLPVIATACGGPQEIINHDQQGILVPIKDSQALATALVSLLHDPQRAEQMVKAATVRVRETFSLQSMLDKYRTLYLNLLKIQ